MVEFEVFFELFLCQSAIATVRSEVTLTLVVFEVIMEKSVCERPSATALSAHVRELGRGAHHCGCFCGGYCATWKWVFLRWSAVVRNAQWSNERVVRGCEGVGGCCWQWVDKAAGVESLKVARGGRALTSCG